MNTLTVAILLFFVALAAATPAPHPIYSFSGIIFTETNWGINSTIYLDVKNQLARVDVPHAPEKHYDNNLDVVINDYINKIHGRVFHMVHDNKFFCSIIKHDHEVNLFTTDGFKQAKYAGITTELGRIVHKWSNVTTAYAQQPIDTVYQDAFTGETVLLELGGEFKSRITHKTLERGEQPKESFIFPKELNCSENK
jgi:hypothetical protein